MQFLIVGDSHTQYFGISNQLRALEPSLRGIRAVTKAVSASTVAGVGKVDSTLQLGQSIRTWVDKVDPDFLVLNLGQVDLELGIPFRRFVKGEDTPESEWVKYFVDEYMSYIKSINMQPERIIVKGVNLPVLCYDHDKAIKYIARIVTERFTDVEADVSKNEEILEDLRRRYPSDVVRTDLANKFNESLKIACTKNGNGYFDINGELARRPHGTIDPKFIPSKFDHHIIDSLEVRSIHWQALLDIARTHYWS